MLTDRFSDALTYAEEVHRRQNRKGTEVPYVAHLLAVCALVLEHGGDEDQAIAALLHDMVEDQGGLARLNEIREKFGERVADMVAACSDAVTSPKPPWDQRKQKYLALLAEHDPAIRLVSCADKLHNARAILRDYESQGNEVWQRFNGGKQGTLWYYRSLADRYLALNLGPMAVELKRVVTRLEEAAGGLDTQTTSKPKVSSKA
ncbi:MAG: HD domain-containing protein [Gammaproteobacteria bacterium]|nr:HD domain-containing protein [Gammaproteobacteria bacterium]MDE2345456.1 HD domain-containing protein [Gammaproteobacteria bacterium]